MTDIVKDLQMWVEAERAAFNQNHVRHLTRSLGEIVRLQEIIKVAHNEMKSGADASAFSMLQSAVLQMPRQ